MLVYLLICLCKLTISWYVSVILFQAICDVLTLPEVCCAEQFQCQTHLLGVVSAILYKAGQECLLHSFSLFYVVVNVLALQSQNSLEQEVRHLFSCYFFLTE